jgi:outer membrane immunogenic protein
MQAGYAVGGGLEYAFTRNLSAKVEYQYIDLGNENYAAPLLFCGVTPCIGTAFAEHTSMRTDFHTVRLGLNWRWSY